MVRYFTRRWKQGFYTLTVLAALCSVASVAAAAVTWEKGYSLPSGRFMVQGQGGGYASMGFLYEKIDGGKFSPRVFKADALGQAEWYKQYSAATSMQPEDIVPTADGGYVVCGGSWVMKLDGNGVVAWSKGLIGRHASFTRTLFAKTVVQAEDGGFVVLAQDSLRRGYASRGKHLWLVKLDQEGVIEWQKSYQDPVNLYPQTLTKLADGSYLVTAYYMTGNLDALVMKVADDGEVVWSKVVGGPLKDAPMSVNETEDGGLVMAGYFLNNTDENPWLLALDANGGVLWGKQYKSVYDARYPVRLVGADDGGFLLVGTKTGLHPYALKVDADGIDQWWAPFSRGLVAGFQRTADGGYAAAVGGSRYWVYKLDAGMEHCTSVFDKNYGTNTVDYAFAAMDLVLTVEDTSCSVRTDAVVVTELIQPEPFVSCAPETASIAYDAGALAYGFGALEVGTADSTTMLVWNEGGSVLEISSVEVTGGDADQFAVASDCGSLYAGESCVVEVTFAPTATGAKGATVILVSNDPQTPQVEIPLSGEGVDLTPPQIVVLDGAATVEAGTPYVDAGATAFDNVIGDLTGAIVVDNPVDTSVVGDYTVTYTVSDASGNVATSTRLVTVVDTIAPTVSIETDRGILWPPNHKLADVLVAGNAADDGSGIAAVEIAVSDEYGEYDTVLDGFDQSVALEAWRKGQDRDGRVYTLTVTATDKAGNSATTSTEVLVPHDMRK